MSTVTDSVTLQQGTAGTTDWKRAVAIVIGGLAVGHAPLLFEHFRMLWDQPQYQYFPFVLAAVGYLLWSRWQTGEPRPTRAGESLDMPSLVLGAAWLMLSLGVFLYDPWLGVTSAILSTAVVISLVIRDRRVVNLWGIWCLLWLIVPLPMGWDQRLIVSLQSLSSSLSSQVMDLMRINHLMAGNVLQLPDKQFFVDEACSGIVSVMSVIACGAIYAVWLNRSLLHTVLLLIAGIGWAVGLNVTRIITIAAAHHYLEMDLSSGTPHELLGLVLFLLVFVALISTDRLLYFALAPINLEPEISQHPNHLIHWWNRATNWMNPGIESRRDASPPEPRQALSVTIPRAIRVLAIAFAVLGVTHVVAWGVTGSPTEGRAVQTVEGISEQFFQRAPDGWKVNDFEMVEREENDGYGEKSKTFRLEHAGLRLTAVASIDYPFRGSWHELSYCYELSGWTKQSRAVLDPSEGDWKYIESSYTDPSDRHAFLVYSILDNSGEPVSPPAGGLQERIWRRMRRRGPSTAWPTMLQVQVWCEQAEPINEDQRQALLELFLEFRKSFHELVPQSPAR